MKTLLAIAFGALGLSIFFVGIAVVLMSPTYGGVGVITAVGGGILFGYAVAEISN